MSGSVCVWLEDHSLDAWRRRRHPLSRWWALEGDGDPAPVAVTVFSRDLIHKNLHLQPLLKTHTRHSLTHCKCGYSDARSRMPSDGTTSTLPGSVAAGGGAANSSFTSARVEYPEVACAPPCFVLGAVLRSSWRATRAGTNRGDTCANGSRLYWPYPIACIWPFGCSWLLTLPSSSAGVKFLLKEVLTSMLTGSYLPGPGTPFASRSDLTSHGALQKGWERVYAASPPVGGSSGGWAEVVGRPYSSRRDGAGASAEEAAVAASSVGRRHIVAGWAEGRWAAVRPTATRRLEAVEEAASSIDRLP